MSDRDKEREDDLAEHGLDVDAKLPERGQVAGPVGVKSDTVDDYFRAHKVIVDERMPPWPPPIDPVGPLGQGIQWYTCKPAITMTMQVSFVQTGTFWGTIFGKAVE